MQQNLKSTRFVIALVLKLVLINDLLDRGASVTAYDPVATNEAKWILGHNSGLSFASDAVAALVSADALVIVTE